MHPLLPRRKGQCGASGESTAAPASVRPDTEAFSAPSSLRFLPLVLPVCALNRRFQEEHSARILWGFAAHPALRAFSRWAPLQQPLRLLRCPGCGPPHILSLSEWPARDTPPPPPAGCPHGCHHLPWHCPNSCHTRLLSHQQLSQTHHGPAPSHLCTGGPPQPWEISPGHVPPTSSPAGRGHLPKCPPQTAGWVRNRRRNQGRSCHTSRGRHDVSCGLIGY